MPNSFHNGLTFIDRLSKGITYLVVSFRADYPAFILFFAALFLAFKSKNARLFAALAGCTLSAIYVVTTAAASTHMGGRFLSVALFLGLLCFSIGLKDAKIASVVGILLGVHALTSSVAPIKAQSRFYEILKPEILSAMDTRHVAQWEGSGLFGTERDKNPPAHAWIHYGKRYRSHSSRIHLGGASGGSAIGYFGFEAGPEKYILDYLAISDPLLSKLEACEVSNLDRLISGHFFRAVPKGYVESIVNSENQIENRQIHEYYEKLRSVISGPIFSRERLWNIYSLNWGEHKTLLVEAIHPYLKRTGLCKTRRGMKRGPLT